MSRFNTGNPLGSGSPLDLDDNAKNMDEAVNSSTDTFQDRLGNSRLTWAGIVKAGSGDPAIAVDAAARANEAADRAEDSESSVEQNAEQIAQDAAQQAVDSVVIAVDDAVDRADDAAARAEAASDAAFVNADVYPDVATGLAAVADGEQFQVVEGEEIVRYRRNSASTQTEMARFPAAHLVRSISAKLPFMLRQVDSIAEGLSVTNIGERFLVSEDAGASIYRVITNLYNPFDAVEDYFVNTANGNAFWAVGWAHSADIAVTPGSKISISSNAPIQPGIAFYTSDGTPILPVYRNGASFTITAPASATYMRFNVKSPNIPEPSEIMVNLGEPVDFLPFGQSLAVKTDTLLSADGVAPDSRKPLSITINPTAGNASQVSAGGLTRSFVAIPQQNVLSYPVRFNLIADSMNGSQVRVGVDDIAPDHIDSTTVGANHGYMLGEVAASGHGKTVADCGSLWVISGLEAVLADVLDSDRLLMARVDANSAPPSGTYSHVSGAANTGVITVTAVTARQWYPPHNNHSITILADGQKIEPGEYSAESVQFVERADILARADIITAWIANGGIPGGYEPDAPASVSESITYRYDRRAQLTIAKSWLFTKEIPVGDLMGLQMMIGDAETYIIPGSLPFNYQGSTVDYSLGVPANNTLASGVSVYMDSSNLQSAGEYANRVLAVYPDAILAIGFLPVGDAAPDVRRSRVSNAALEIRGNTGKLYFQVLNKGAHVAEVGDNYSVCSYRFILPKSDDRTAFYAVEGGGATWVYADWHDKNGVDRLPIDEQYPELIGRSFEVVEARNVTVSAGVIAGSLPVIVSADGSSASLILKVV